MTDVSYEGLEKYFDMVTISASKIYGAAKKSGARAVQPELKDELYSSGMVALLEAWKNFDKSRNASFRTYAFYRIRGAMLDHLRNEDTVSRSVRAKLKKLVLDIDNNVSSEELSREQIDKTLRQSIAVFQFLDPSSDENAPEMDFRDEYEYHETIDTRETISKLFKLCPLTDNEVAIIKEHYFENRNFSVIGKDLGITESRVSQIHKAALQKLEKYV